MYSSDSDSVVEWYVTGLPGSPVLNIAGSFSGPLNPNRGMAHDPVTDHFWTANWASDIYEFDRTGMVHGNWSNTYSIYGMAWDDVSPDGPWLWVFTQEAPGAVVYQWDPIIHDYTGLFLDLSQAGGIAAGAAFTTDWNPRYGILFCLHQADPDAVIGYEIVPLCEPVEPPQMRSQGYWRRQCKDDAHEDICAHVDSIHVLADLFDAFDCDSICDLMRVNPPERYMCRKARRQFMALLLNVASGKLSVCNCLEDGREVGDVIVEVDSLLSGSPDHATCVYAKTLADDINTGTSIVPCDTLFYIAPPKSVLLVSPSIAPNPFVNTTTIQYEVPVSQSVRVQIYDKTGRLVRALVDARHEPGSYYIEWNGRDEVRGKVPGGIYFSRVQVGNSIRSNKLILLR